MLNKLNNNKNISLEIIFDDNFNGMMYGLPEESVGCKLKGKVVLNNRKSFLAKTLSFLLLGKITVACGPPMSASRPEYSETRLILRKECTFHNSTISRRKIHTGTHEYHFDIDLPGCLPSSFKGTRGKIEYYCSATLTRPLFYNDLTVKKTVNIKRCLMDETRITQSHHTTFTEGLLDEKISYQISTPIMTFSEGGLVQTELKLKSTSSDIIIEAIEYGLKEQINYHTTGEEAMSITANVDEDRYPLGRRRIKTNRPEDENLTTINFRLCPWVNCDIDSQLISVKHKLSFTVCVSEVNDDVLSEEANSRRSSRRFSAAGSRVGRYKRSSAFSLSSIVSPQRTVASKVERKRLNFEVPIVVTSKSHRLRQQSPPYATVDRPPAYAIASMIPPPPEYVGRDILEHSNDSNASNEFIVYDL